MTTLIYHCPFINSKEIFTITLTTDCTTSIRKSSDGRFHLTANNLDPCLIKISVKPGSGTPAQIGVIEVDHIGEPLTDKGEHLGRIDGRATVSVGRFEFDIFGGPENLLDNGEYINFEIYLELFDEQGSSGFDIYTKYTLTTV